jgi:hypothetical protein
LLADKFGLNAGVFFIKVDKRSLQFLDEVLLYENSGTYLEFFEQSAMEKLIKKKKLEQSGDFVRFPMGYFNSYAGMAAVKKPTAIFQLHFPSLRFKRKTLLPLIEALSTGNLSLTERDEDRKYVLEDEVREFWRHWQKVHRKV